MCGAQWLLLSCMGVIGIALNTSLPVNNLNSGFLQRNVSERAWTSVVQLSSSTPRKFLV